MKKPWEAGLHAVISGERPLSNTISSKMLRLVNPVGSDLSPIWILKTMNYHVVKGWSNQLEFTEVHLVPGRPAWPEFPASQTHILRGNMTGASFQHSLTVPSPAPCPLQVLSTYCWPKFHNLFNCFSHSFLETASMTEISTKAFPFTQKQKCS